jgi:hypothetical protein
MAKPYPAHLLQLAMKGAAHRYQELKAELAALVKAFPHLEFGSAVSPAMPVHELPEESIASRGPKRTRRMSAAQRRAVSLRMKKYWAARRKENQ